MSKESNDFLAATHNLSLTAQNLSPTAAAPAAAATQNLPEATANREQLHQFWASYAHSPTMASMMLNKDADALAQGDLDDVLNALPDVTGKKVVEIGAGIGRFTPYLAEKAKSVVATDFIESFIRENERLHGHMKNVTFLCSDAVNFESDDSVQDFVFTNWLMMYLTDPEVCLFFKRVLGWLVPGGIFHCRESCSQASTTAPKNCTQNPTFYRHASEYMQLLRFIRWTASDGKIYGFQVEWSDSINTYIERKNNWRQVRMLATKVEIRNENGIPKHVGIKSESNFKPVGDQSDETLLRYLRETHNQQKVCDAKFAKIQGIPFSPQEKIVSEVLKKLVVAGQAEGLLNLSPAAINTFNLAESLNTAVLGTTNDPFTYAAMLGIANQRIDQRVRFMWSDFDQSDTESRTLEKNFNFAVAVDFWSTVADRNMGQIFRRIRSQLRSGAFLIWMENSALKIFDGHLTILTQNGLKLIEMKKVPDSEEKIDFAPEIIEDCSAEVPSKEIWRLAILQTI